MRLEDLGGCDPPLVSGLVTLLARFISVGIRALVSKAGLTILSCFLSRVLVSLGVFVLGFYLGVLFWGNCFRVIGCLAFWVLFRGLFGICFGFSSVSLDVFIDFRFLLGS